MPGTALLDSKIVLCKLSPGLGGAMEDFAVVNIVEGSIGLVHPDQAGEFYDLMHSYLSKVGITAFKVDVIQIMEVGWSLRKGLSKSLAQNFNGIGLISSMQQCNDFFLLGTQEISMGRVGDDFWYQDPNGDPMGVCWSQGVHMIHCAYNSMWMGQFIQPDWDMFQSDHLCKNSMLDLGLSVRGRCAGRDPKEKRIKGYSHCYTPISGSVHVSDIEWDQKKDATEMGKVEEYAVYLSESDKLLVKMRI
ncbi:unnamed protein product [Fraxinus pennsylvanica]|uniref:Uncharacterized protein n=1 Tax=Fraxinus pennsylvanica TaxID=56036 RepID=A0AAD2A747_9LAMI|nr:unnamed protein product [Fraxinus pennsylvanica]